MRGRRCRLAGARAALLAALAAHEAGGQTECLELLERWKAHHEGNSGQYLSTADLSNRGAEISGPGVDTVASTEGKPVHRLYSSMQGTERTEEFIAAERACATSESGFSFWLAHIVFMGRTPPYVPQDMSLAYSMCVPSACGKDEIEPVTAQWVQANIRSICFQAVQKGLQEAQPQFSAEEAGAEVDRIKQALMYDYPVHVWLESFEQRTTCEQELHAQWGYFWEHSGQKFQPASVADSHELRAQEDVLKAWRLCKRADFGFHYWLAHTTMTRRSRKDNVTMDQVPFTFGLCLPTSCAMNDAEPIATYIVRDVMSVSIREEMNAELEERGIHVRDSEEVLNDVNIQMRLELLSDLDSEGARSPEEPAAVAGASEGSGLGSGVDSPQTDPRDGPFLVDEGLPCDLPRRFVFLDTSWHSGARMDVAAVLASLNQTVLLPRFLGYPRNPPWPQLQTKGLGSLTAVETGSEIFHAVLRHPWTGGRIGKLSEAEVRKHFEALRDNPILSEVDAIICTGAASACEIWMPFNKTIVAVSSMGGRYSLGRCTAAEWQRLDEHLRALAASEGPRHVVAANSRWSAMWLELYAGVEPVLLESFPWFYVQPAAWLPTRPEILVHCQKASPPQMCPELVAEINRRVAEHRQPGDEHWTFQDIYDLYPSYTLEDLVRHRAVVAIPYGHFNFGVAEMYSMNIPLFLPSASFLTALCPGAPPCHVNGSLIAPVGDTLDALHDGLGCGSVLAAEAAKTSAAGTSGASGESRCPRHEQWLQRAASGGVHAGAHSSGAADPHPWPMPESTCEDRQAFAYWLQFVEAYRYPHAVTFGSWGELASALATTDFQRLHEAMRTSALRHARRLRKRWCDALRGALVDPAPRVVPATYEEALAALGVPPGGSFLNS